MREIKFRGYSKEDNQWHYGYLLRSEKGYYIDDGFCNNIVEEESIGQYTGYIDKNKKEIYEGDTVKDKRDNIWTVYFDKEFGMWMIHTEKKREVLYEDDKDYEVIGNIYEENKEDK